MITATITRRIPITQLRPGALIDSHTVDSIELGTDGAAAWCWPPGRTTGRRVRLPLGALDGEVTVSVDNSGIASVVNELSAAIRASDGRIVAGENTLLAVELPSGWTFALHGEEPATEATGPLPVPDDDTEED